MMCPDSSRLLKSPFSPGSVDIAIEQESVTDDGGYTCIESCITDDIPVFVDGKAKRRIVVGGCVFELARANMGTFKHTDCGNGVGIESVHQRSFYPSGALRTQNRVWRVRRWSGN